MKIVCEITSPRFDGYEAVACDGNELWLSIEVENLKSIYHGYVVRALIDLKADPATITVDASQLWNIDSFSQIANMGEEAILLDGKRIITFHELNDPRLFQRGLEQALLILKLSNKPRPRFHIYLLESPTARRSTKTIAFGS